MRRRFCALVVAVATTMSCDPKPPPTDHPPTVRPGDTVVTPVGVRPRHGDSVLVGSTPDAECPKRGFWRTCSVEDRLIRAGLAIRAGRPVRHDFFSVPGTEYVMSRGSLEVYVYPSVEARERDTTALDATTVSPRAGPRFVWAAAPTLVVSENLAAVIVSHNARLVERIQLALEAGLPR